MFPTTRWQSILALRDEPSARGELLERLGHTYWRPLYSHARAKGLTHDHAEDAVQAVFVRLLEGDFVAALDPRRGRLRCYLRAAMNHHLADLRARDHAAKRGGNTVVVPLDDTIVAGSQDPSAEFDRTWARALLDRAFERLRDEYASGSRTGPFDAVTLYFRSAGSVGHAELADRFGMSIPQLKAFLHRARCRFRELVRAEVVATVANPRDVDGELRHVESALTS